LIEELGIATHPQHLAGDAVYHAPGATQRMEGNPIDVPSGRFVAGAQALADGVARTLGPGVVTLSRPVQGIEAGPEYLQVTTAAGPIRARHVILAVPPALAVSRIEFSPSLPEDLVRLAQHTPVWMGGMTKVVARYGHAFWRAQGLAGAGISHVGPLREIHDMSGPEGFPAQLFGFVPPTALGAPTASSAEILGQLQAMFGPEAAKVEQLWVHDWRHEEYTSPVGVEGLHATHLFGHPLFAAPALAGRVHWASTETASQSPGHIEGALAAAGRAARAILSAA